ncbi:MAG: MBL fold metallo-hydrolase [Myxococcales bacterium]|nr:MBL fold metallo-hydrolase [Myxococcales bacterium]
MEIISVGAAGTVTGSKHLVRTSSGTVLLDCGLFQGRRRESIEENRTLGFSARDIDAVVLSHAHIDHSGALPILVKQGFRGSVYSTPATHDLATAMLKDAANIQEQDARYVNKVIDRDGIDMLPVEPLYDEADVDRTLTHFVPVSYRVRKTIAPGFSIVFYDAGHVLGSAVTCLDVDDDGEKKRVVFTGDLGRRGTPILRDPEVVSGANLLIMESTYGDRVHPPYAGLENDLADVITRVVARGGKIVIPTFALERAQEVVYALKRLRKAKRVPIVPVYVDSPLTVKVTEVFQRHPDCFDEEAREHLTGDDSPFDFDGLSYVSEKVDSQAIDVADGPAIILSASGMCEAGRVLHHLRATVEDPKNAVIIVGFQAQHTLGRRIVERRPRIRIFGVERDLRAEVVVLNGFSAHADRDDLLAYAEATRERGKLREVVLVHGEDKSLAALRESLLERSFPTVHIARPRETHRF